MEWLQERKHATFHVSKKPFKDVTCSSFLCMLSFGPVSLHFVYVHMVFLPRVSLFFLVYFLSFVLSLAVVPDQCK